MSEFAMSLVDVSVGLPLGEFCPKKPHKFSLASSAHPGRIGRVYAGVLLRKLMAPFTVRLGRIFSRRANTAQDVLSRCHWFEVRRVYARWNSAQVIKKHPIWDWAYEVFVGKAVGHDALPVHLDLSIPDSALVQPARFGLRDLFPKSFRRTWFLKFRRTRPANSEVVF
jgi:hypothetical protein